MRKKRITPAMAVALVALVFAVSGVAIAAPKLIEGNQIAAETVTGTNVKDGSLEATELSADALVTLKGNKGDTGEQGIQGIQGIPGPKGVSGYEIVQKTAGPFMPLEETASLYADCPMGKKVISGGGVTFGATTPTTEGLALEMSYPSIRGTSLPESWGVRVRKYGTVPEAWYVRAFAICANVD